MTNAHPIKTTLLLAATQLIVQGIEVETAKLEAQLLLQHVLNVNRAWLISHENDALQANIHAVFEALLNRRLNGEPIAYILGSREFYGLNLKVSPDTLIPRPDTETLVEAALAKTPQNDNTSSPSFPHRRESSSAAKNKIDSRLRGNDGIEGYDPFKSVTNIHHAWVAGTMTTAIWQNYLDNLSAIKSHTQQQSSKLQKQTDLASKLVIFCNNI